MRRLFLPLLLLATLATACDGWVYVVPTFPAPPASPTPMILSPTALILTAIPSNTAAWDTPSPSATPTEVTAEPATATPTTEPTGTPTSGAPLGLEVQVEVLGCSTSFDITHGMGEVTDAFVTIHNTGESPLNDLCATLYALDEGRPHPDKTVCVPELPGSHMVTLKLTVDSTYQKDTPIQVEVKSSEQLITRVGQPSCSDMNLAPVPPPSLKTPFPNLP